MSNPAGSLQEKGKDSDASSSSVDGIGFLKHLRDAGEFDQGNNEDTVATTTKSNHRQDLSDLSDLFRNDKVLEGAKNPSSSSISPQPSHPSRPENQSYSAISAPSALTAHPRSVSWAKNNRDYYHTDTDVPSFNGNNDQHRQKITLDDLARGGPYVEDAEANIIRGLEEQQSIRDLRSRSNTDSSTILSQVPENAVHDFTTEEEEGRQKQQNSSGRGERNEEEANDKAPLISKNHKPHRRVMTVEDALAELTDAMHAIHAPHSTDDDDTRSVSSDSEREAGRDYTTADAFAENVARLDDDQGGRGQASRRRAGTLWKTLRENLPALKQEVQRRNLEETTRNYSLDSREEMPSDVESQQDVRFESFNESSLDERTSKHSDPHEAPSLSSRHNSSRRRRRRSRLTGARDRFKEDLDVWRSFFRPRKDHIWVYMRMVFFYAIAPLLGVAAALFYFGHNPIRGLAEDGKPGDKPSVSWCLIFCVRQIVTFSIALSVQGIVIDFLALGTKTMLRIVGPIITLLVVQSKGWPFICFWWSIFDFAMLSGSNAFAKHWCYWQNAVELFNDKNPSGHVVNSSTNHTVLTIVASVTVVVAVKRFVVGLYLGRQTFNHYGQNLSKVMHKVVLVSEVAGLAKSIEKAQSLRNESFSVPAESGEQMRGIAIANSEETDDHTIDTSADERSENGIRTDLRDPLTGSLQASEKAKLMDLLGRWEEPDKVYDSRHTEIATISAVLRFRKALTFIQKQYPFSYAFGPADTREACVDSSQKVYDRLMMRTPNEKVLQFETLALLALKEDGKTIDQRKAKDLVKLFRPDRQGNLTMLDFVRSVDTVYKEFRLLNASIVNSGQIDRAFENIINVVFYSIVITVVLSQLGFNPLALFLSLSSVILAFAFMIGSASAKYFEGLLFILVRRPYNIGDRIHVSNVERDTQLDGAPGWLVENVTLFETVATWAPTNERCSLSNGSLANSRIINWGRSQQAQFLIFYKIPIETPYEKIVTLKNAVETYLRARPREWISLNGFRANNVVTEQGYIEYIIVILHRDSWQNIGYILDCKANFLSYVLEVTKQLNMHYKAPPLPIDLRHSKPIAMQEKDDNHSYKEEEDREPEKDEEAQMREFRSQALNKYHIMC